MSVEWVRLELDLASYEPPPIDASSMLDIRLTTLAELGDSDSTKFQLFELNRECSADIPERGSFHSWDEYQELRLDVPSFDPAGVSLALEGHEWVGMASFTTHPDRGDGYVFCAMTGVRRAWRRKGLATALKAHNIEIARQTALRMMRTVHHPANTAMITLNRHLGFTDASWNYP